MTAPPTVSCVILCHNYGRYLDRAIKSCLTQQAGEYRLYEVVVIDDGSTDETTQVCARWATKIKIVGREQRGFAASLTDAIRLSRGEWVALLDADDWFHPAKLRTCAPHMKPPALVIQHWEHVVREDGQPLLDRPHPGGNTSTLIVERRAAQTLLPVSNEIFFHALGETGHGVELSDPLTYYRVHPKSMTDRRTAGVSQDYRARVAHDLADRLEQLRAAPPPWATHRQLDKAAARFRSLAAGHQVEAAIQLGTRKQALRPLCRMVIDTIRAGHPLRSCTRAMASVATGRPQVGLDDRTAKRQPTTATVVHPENTPAASSPEPSTAENDQGASTNHEPFE